MLKKKLQTWMVKKECSRNQLAELLQVSPRTVAGWLAHKSRPISAKMQKSIETLISPDSYTRTLSPAEKEFFAMTNKKLREFWLRHKIEQILVLSHRAMAYWDSHYPKCFDDAVFYEEVTDITQQIRDFSSDVTSLGAHHADSILFNEFDENGDKIV